MQKYFILDKEKNIVETDFITATLFKLVKENCCLFQEGEDPFIGDFALSTVFIGLELAEDPFSNAYGDDRREDNPEGFFFETAVFPHKDRVVDDAWRPVYAKRFRTYAEAEEGHRAKRKELEELAKAGEVKEVDGETYGTLI